jgi:hypothetical protein
LGRIRGRVRGRGRGRGRGRVRVRTAAVGDVGDDQVEVAQVLLVSVT